MIIKSLTLLFFMFSATEAITGDALLACEPVEYHSPRDNKPMTKCKKLPPEYRYGKGEGQQ